MTLLNLVAIYRVLNLFVLSAAITTADSPLFIEILCSHHFMENR